MKSEQELRDAVRRSREQGYRELFEQYSGYVYAVIWYRIRSFGTHEDAEEAVSDVFSRLFRNFDKIEEGKLHNYICTITVNIATDTIRRLSSRPELLSDEEHEWQEAVSPEDVERDCELSEMRQILLDNIRNLGEPDTTIMMMICFYGRSTEETAKKVGLSAMAVRKRLSRIRKKLKKLLRDAGYSI